MSAEQNSFALRHQARRAALLAAVLRKQWDEMNIDPTYVTMPLSGAAARMSDEGWISAADKAGITPPSNTTKAITIGLLSAPQLKGLVG